VAVVSTGQARESLHSIARRFDAGESEPVSSAPTAVPGVIVPVAVWEQLLEHVEDDLASTRGATGPRLSHADVAALMQHLAVPTK